MKILFDECVPKRLKKYFAGHDVKTVPEAGWAGVKNGELLSKAAQSFDVILTVDRNLGFQRTLGTLMIPVIIIHSPSNRLKDLEPHMTETLKLLEISLTKTLHHIGAR